MTNKLSEAIHYLFAGFKLLRRRELRSWVIIPLLLNIFLLILLFGISIHYFNFFLSWISGLLPSWLSWLNSLFWLLFMMAGLLFLIFCFTTLASIIAAPFNGLLAEKTESLLTSKPLAEENFWKSLIKILPYSLKQQWRFLQYYLPRAIGCFILFFIPGIQLFAPFIWFLFNAWVIALQYMAYPAENHQIPFNEIRAQLKQKWLLHLSFGSIITFILMIPFLNLIVMPAAVAAATLIYVNEHSTPDTP